MVAGVVEKEHGPRIRSQQLRDRQRTAKRGTEALLKVLRFCRRMTVQRERRRVERRGIEALKNRAADLVRSAAAEPRSAASAESAGHRAAQSRTASAPDAKAT